jgi:hypothetical protein
MADNEYLGLIGAPAQPRQAPQPQPGGKNEYLDLIDSNVIALPRAQAGALKKPDQAGQAVQLGQSMGFPSSVIGADLENYQQIDKGQKAAQAIERNQWISGYVARNPEAAEVSNDDYDKLETLSKKVQPFTIAGRSGGLLQAAPEFVLNTLPQLGSMLSTSEGRSKLLGGVTKFGEQFASILGSPRDAEKQGFDIHDPADLDRAMSLGMLIGLGKQAPKVGLPVAAKFEIGVKSVSTGAELDRFLIDAILTKGQDPKTVLQIEHAKADSAALDSAVAAASETATKGRAPTLLDDFVKGHETGTLSIPAETIAEVYRAEGKVPVVGDGLFGFVPDLARKLPGAADTGTEIDVPVASYLAHIDPTVHEKVKKAIRFSNDGMTLAEAKEADPNAIEAFHGSPHTFDAFDISKIGTGEGAQSYGHGLYFAENPEVASIYKERLAGKAAPMGGVHGGQLEIRQEQGMWNVYQDGELVNAFGAKSDAERYINQGSFYKVAITANREHFLDWDKPLSEQPQAVKDYFTSQYNRLKEAGLPFEVSSEMTGEELYRGLTGGAYDARLPSPESVSSEMAAAGIPGIKYLDQGSRIFQGAAGEARAKQIERALKESPSDGTPEGNARIEKLQKELDSLSKPTSNFVIFDPASVTILERNGQALRAAAQVEETELGLRPLLTEPLPGQTKTDFERYNKKIIAAQQKALDKATEVQTREATKRQGEEWKANEAALRPEVEAEVRVFPDIAADRFLRDGTLPDGSTMPKVRLDEGYVNALLPKTEIPAMMLAKDGIHPDDIAPLFGFNSGAEMVRSLNDLNAARRGAKESPTQHLNRLIKEELNAQMEAKYGNLDASIAEEARALALDDLHFDILADELRALATEAGGTMPISKDGIKALVQDHFARLDAKEAANFEKFQKAAGRNGLLAERALLKGDAIEAFNAKQKQAMNFLLAKEAQKFGKLVDRIAKKIDRVTKNDSISSMNQEHFNQLRSLLSDLGFDTKGDVTRSATSLGDFVANSDGQLAVAAWLTDGTMLPRDPSKLTVQQMTELGKSIDSMMHVGREVKTLDSARGKAGLQNVIFDVKGELDRFDFVANPLNPTVGQRAKGLARWVSAWSLLVERMLDYTDKFDPNGPLTTYLDRPLRDANVKEIQLNENVTRALRKLSELTDNSINDIIPNNVIPSVRNDSGFLDMNRRNLRQLMGYMGSESGIAKVVNGWKVDEAAVWKLINDNATKADWQWVAGMHKIFEGLWAEAAAMIERDTGVPADKIDPKVMKSEKFGDFPGGYWPIKYDRIDSNIEGHVAGKRSLFDKHYVYAATPQAYTLPRTEWWGALDLSGQLIASHLRGVIHDIAFREAVRNAAKLINSQEFMSEMTQKWGKEYAGLMPGWIKDIANAHNVDDSYAQGAARFFSLVRQNLTATLIAWNPGTVIKHGGTALGMSAAAVGPGKFLSSTWEFGLRGMAGAAKDLMTGQVERPTEQMLDALKAVTDPGEYGDGVRQFILDSSAVMRNRQRQSMDNIREQMNRNLRSGGTQTFMDFRGAALDFGRVPIAASDAVSAFPTWLAAYKESMARTGDHAQSVFEADKQVSRAHGSGFIGDKPRVLRTGEAMRWVTPLYNFFNHNFNMALQWAWDAGAKWKGRDEPGANIGSLSNRMFWGFMMAVAMEELAAPALDQSKRGIGTSLLLAGIRHVGAWMPGLRDFTNALASGYEPSVGFLGTVAKTIADTAKDVSKSLQAGKTVSQNWLVHTATAIGLATGIGGSQFGRTGSYLKDRATGRERTPRTWDELRQGLRTGHSKSRVH